MRMSIAVEITQCVKGFSCLLITANTVMLESMTSARPVSILITISKALNHADIRMLRRFLALPPNVTTQGSLALPLDVNNDTPNKLHLIAFSQLR